MDTVTGNPTIDLGLAVLGALVPLTSLLAAVLNSRVRTAEALGQPLSPGKLKAIAAVNVVAVNLDKANQLVKIATGRKALTTEPAPVSRPPTPPRDDTGLVEVQELEAPAHDPELPHVEPEPVLANPLPIGTHCPVCGR